MTARLPKVFFGWRPVLEARFVDRFGKGVRAAPRDAIIADSTAHGVLGRAFRHGVRLSPRHGYQLKRDAEHLIFCLHLMSISFMRDVA